MVCGLHTSKKAPTPTNVRSSLRNGQWTKEYTKLLQIVSQEKAIHYFLSAGEPFKDTSTASLTPLLSVPMKNVFKEVVVGIWLCCGYFGTEILNLFLIFKNWF